MGHKYRSNDSMSALISDDYQLLQVLSRFDIPLGFGDKSVEEVCTDCGVDADTFLVVCNFVSSGTKPTFDEYASLSVGALLNYLRNSHRYFLDFMMPHIRQRLVSAIDMGSSNDVAFLIMKFFDDYTQEVTKHMEFEEAEVFKYVDGLLDGHRDPEHSLQEFETQMELQSHKNIDSKMSDLKNILVRYVPPTKHTYLLNHALMDLFALEQDLSTHTQLEDTIFCSAVSLLESQVDVEDEDRGESPENSKEPLSDREKDIIVGVVKGLTNKEIANSLCISIHTVLTHRRNIAKKLEIHSPAGLVIYAIVNGIVKVEDIKSVIE